MEEMLPKSTTLRTALQRAKQPASPGGGMLTVEEACQYLRISKWTLYRLIQSGTLRTIKIGSRRLIPMQALQDFVGQLESQLG